MPSASRPTAPTTPTTGAAAASVPATGPTGIRAERREEVTARILEIGRAHLVDHGAAALSLRAVTRDLGMVSSAVYRYVGGRDELLTLLVVDAYTELADAVDTALARARPGLEPQVLALAGALRDWGLAEPSRYALLYGSPVPGYEAPGEQTVEPGTRVMRRLVRVLDAAVSAGEVPTGRRRVPMPRALARDLAAVRGDFGVAHADDAVLAGGVFLWTALLGAVSAEVFGQFGEETFVARTPLFEHGIRLALSVLRD